MAGNRLLKATVALVGAARAINVLAVAFLAVVVVGSFVMAPVLTDRLAAKYGAAADIPAKLMFLRAVALLAIPVGYAVERLLRALRAILRTVEAGDPFDAANAGRLRTIGWMLLAIQLADLVGGAAAALGRHIGVEGFDWRPSFTGWFAVLVAFVLVRVFAAGAALRDDLDGTV